MQTPTTTHPDLMKLASFEEVAFTYDSIERTWEGGDITASDSWDERID